MPSKNARACKALVFPLPADPFFSGIDCFDQQTVERGRRAFVLRSDNVSVRLRFIGRSYKLQFQLNGRRLQVGTGVKTEQGGIEAAVCWLREQKRLSSSRSHSIS